MNTLWLSLAILLAVAIQFSFVALFFTWWYRPKRLEPGQALPAISLLMPCEGDEPGLEENLEAAVRAEYPAPRQVIFCTSGPDDPSVALVSRVRERLEANPVPGVEVLQVFSQDRPAALNRKMRHLAAALELARHPVIVAADSDNRLTGETLQQLVGALQRSPRNGLAYAPPHFPDGGSLADQILAFGFSASIHAFYTLKALMDFMRGDRPVVGTLLAIPRKVLDAVGGYKGLGGHIGDDLELGRRVRRLGLEVVTAPVPAPVAQPELTLLDLGQRLHRWIVVAAAYGPARLITYPLLIVPLPMASLLLVVGALLAGPVPTWAWAGLLGLVISRLIFATYLGMAFYRRPPHLKDLVVLPLWELTLTLCAALAMVYRTVTWRGRKLQILPGGSMLSLYEPSRGPVPEVPVRHSVLFDGILPVYGRHLVRQGFGAVWSRGLDRVQALEEDTPVIFAANHSSFWDGILAYFLHLRHLPQRFHVVMEDKQLRRYRFMAHAGAFSINRGSRDSAQQSLRYAEELLSAPGRAVWIFPQGVSVPAGRRPLQLRAGVGQLVSRLGRVYVVPVTMCYGFRAAQRPEAFVSFGTPMLVQGPVEPIPFTQQLETLMTSQLDHLTAELNTYPLEVAPPGFEKVSAGRLGVAERWDRFRVAVGLLRQTP